MLLYETNSLWGWLAGLLILGDYQEGRKRGPDFHIVLVKAQAAKRVNPLKGEIEGSPPIDSAFSPNSPLMTVNDPLSRH